MKGRLGKGKHLIFFFFFFFFPGTCSSFLLQIWWLDFELLRAHLEGLHPRDPKQAGRTSPPVDKCIEFVSGRDLKDSIPIQSGSMHTVWLR